MFEPIIFIVDEHANAVAPLAVALATAPSPSAPSAISWAQSEAREDRHASYAGQPEPL
jgi:hypothetical protein